MASAKAANLAYHLEELKIAGTPGDPRRALPEVPDDVQTILDIGCGAGQTLQALSRERRLMLCGVDVDPDALALGRELDPRLILAKASGESLPFRDSLFDMVLCRVALPYMDVTRAAREMARVLRPGGHLWVTLHPPAMAAQALWRHLRAGEPKGALFQTYVLLNGLTLHCFGRQFQVPGRPMESVQTASGMSRILAAAGFDDVAVLSTSPSFIMTARTSAAMRE